jgi:hypothetical protein
MAGDRKDFVHVKLSAAGEKMAAGAPLGIANARSHFEFRPGVAQEVTRDYEWNAFLSREIDSDGEPIFELVPADQQQ